MPDHARPPSGIQRRHTPAGTRFIARWRDSRGNEKQRSFKSREEAQRFQRKRRWRLAQSHLTAALGVDADDEPDLQAEVQRRRRELADSLAASSFAPPPVCDGDPCLPSCPGHSLTAAQAPAPLAPNRFTIVSSSAEPYRSKSWVPTDLQNAILSLTSALGKRPRQPGEVVAAAEQVGKVWDRLPS